MRLAKARKMILDWRYKATLVLCKVQADPGAYSERAVGEAQGYAIGLRRAADELEKELNR